MKRTYSKYIHIVLSAFITLALHSCTDESDSGNSQIEDSVREAVQEVIIDWGESQEYISGKTQEQDVFILSSEEGYLLLKDKNSDQATVYQFHEDGLCAASVILSYTLPQADIKSILNDYTYIGDLDSSSVYLNQAKNTLAVTYINDTKQVIGFTPIISDAFEKLPLINIITEETQSVGYNSAMISGSITGVEDMSNVATTGVLYDTTPDFLAATNKIQRTSQPSSKFTVQLSNLEQGTTYYYCTAIYIDDTYYLGEVKSFTTLKEPTYNIGDFYPDPSNPEGVVFYISDAGRHGKIVSLDNQKSIKWDTNSIFCTFYGNRNTVDGSKNNMSKNSTLAGGWCYNHGTGWYCPARGELVNLNKAVKSVNATLSKAGYDTLNGFFWSSTENDNNTAYIVCVSQNGYMGYSGGWYGFNSKDQNRSVCAIKKF